MQRSPEQARSIVTTLLLVGVAALIVGGIIIGAAWPHTEVDTSSLYGVSDEESGSWPATIAGMVLASIGQLVVFVALIALGVRLGLESSGGASTSVLSTEMKPAIGAPPVTRRGQKLADLDPLPDRDHMDEDGR